MTNEERAEQIQQAIEMIEEAQQLVDEAVSGTGDQIRFEAFGRFGFDQLLGNGNQFDEGLHSLLEE